MVTDDLEAVVRRVIRQELERLFAAKLTPMQRRTMQAVAGLFEPSEVFTTNGVLDAARYDLGAKQTLMSTCDCNPQKLGIVFAQVVQAGAVVDGLRLVRLPAEGGSRRWTLEPADSL